MFKVIELEKITNGKNIRNELDEEINELAKSIEENGLINPIFVKKIAGGKYEVIAGHRRFEAVKRLRLPYIECNVADDEKSEKDVLLAQIAENVQRKDMSVKVKGHAYYITCSNNAAENALLKFINARKL